MSKNCSPSTDSRIPSRSRSHASSPSSGSERNEDSSLRTNFSEMRIPSAGFASYQASTSSAFVPLGEDHSIQASASSPPASARLRTPLR